MAASSEAGTGGAAVRSVRPRPRPPVKQIVVLALLGLLAVAGVSGQPTAALGLSAPASAALIVMLAAAVLWITEAVPLFVTSFVILLLNITWLSSTLEGSGTAVDRNAFLSPFFSNIILLFLGGFVLSAGLHKFLIDERLARWVLERTGRAPSRVLFGIMAVTTFLSMWMSNTATTAMMLTLALPLLRNVPEDDPCRKAVLLGIPFSANLGGLGTPIGTPPNAIAMRYMADAGIAPSFGKWMLMATPVLAIGFLVLWVLLLRVFPPKVDAVELDEQPTFRWSARSRFVVVVAIVTALGWLTGDLHGVPSGTVALLPVVAFFGLRILDIGDFRGLSWDVLFIVGGGLSLGVAVQDSGLSKAIVALIPGESAGLLVLVLIVAVITAIMTSVMSNTATANLVVPVVIGLSGALVAPLLLIVAHACSVTMALPVSTPPNAMAFSSGQISVRDMLRAGLAISLVGLALTCTVGLWWWRVLGVY